MGRARREDTATEADWSFMGHPEVMDAVIGAAKRLERQYGEEFRDCEHDALLWMAVRPEIIAKHVGTGRFDQLSLDCYSGLSKRQSRSRRIEAVSYEGEFLED